LAFTLCTGRFVVRKLFVFCWLNANVHHDMQDCKGEWHKGSHPTMKFRMGVGVLCEVEGATISTRMLKRRVLPAGFIEPCIPILAHKPPAGPQWVHEIKHDGYRLIVRRDGERVRLFTRRGYDWTERFPAISTAAAKLRAKSFTLDGEAVVCDADGIAAFDELHGRRRLSEAILYAFDLLELNGEDYRPLPFSKRKLRLARLLSRAGAGLAFNEHIEADGASVFRYACKMGLEGVVSKRLDKPYRSGRSGDWIKTKNPDSPAVQRFREGRW
jgi:bifunctional non-homologous end joining protein LigD